MHNSLDSDDEFRNILAITSSLVFNIYRAILNVRIDYDATL